MRREASGARLLNYVRQPAGGNHYHSGSVLGDYVTDQRLGTVGYRLLLGNIVAGALSLRLSPLEFALPIFLEVPIPYEAPAVRSIAFRAFSAPLGGSILPRSRLAPPRGFKFPRVPCNPPWGYHASSIAACLSAGGSMRSRAACTMHPAPPLYDACYTTGRCTRYPFFLVLLAWGDPHPN